MSLGGAGRLELGGPGHLVEGSSRRGQLESQVDGPELPIRQGPGRETEWGTLHGPRRNRAEIKAPVQLEEWRAFSALSGSSWTSQGALSRDTRVDDDLCHD